MRIGIDARFFGPKEKGLGRYTERLVTNLLAVDRENTYVLFMRRSGWSEAPQGPNVERVLADYRWYSFAEQLAFPHLLARARLDLVHFPHFNVPLGYRRPFVVTIHDLILSRYPTVRASTLGPLRYWLKHAAYGLVIRSAVRRAERILAVSEFTKQDIVNHFGVDPGKILVTYEAAEPLSASSAPTDDGSVLGRYGIEEPYLLHVGNAYPHKNLERLLEAFADIGKRRPELSLVLVGRSDYFFERLESRVRALGLGDRVRFPGFVPDADLPSLYRRATAYVFPSLYEGFGLPPFEAMQSDTPVAAARSSSLPEVLGAAAEYFNPEDVDDMIRVISRLIDDEPRRRALRELGRRRVAQFSWRRLAEATLACYRSVSHHAKSS